MDLGPTISAIRATDDLDSLKTLMQGVVESFGFASWCMVDAGCAYGDVPFFMGTSEQRWCDHYVAEGFVHVDPYVAIVRRSNLPFDWSCIQHDLSRRGPRTKARYLMESAYDLGFREGLVFPCHFNDQLGRRHSISCVFYWKDALQDFNARLAESAPYLHMVAIYFIYKVMELSARDVRKAVALFGPAEPASRLTDRERDVISWVARGKTSGETATILALSRQTVETHIANVIRKVDATNRTHAVAKCIQMALIDP